METLPSPFTPEPPKPKPTSWFDKYQYHILGSLTLGLAIGIYFVLTPNASLAEQADTLAADESASTDTSNPIEPATGQIVVDVAGAVVSPGVYYLNSASIVEDAIKSAGGLNRFADTDEIARSVNRAALVVAHSKIYIPKKGERTVVYTEPPTSNLAGASTTSTKININTANTTELDVLPGVGPVTAQRIIDYRVQHGNFATIEAIKNVPGISDGKYEQLRDLITI